MITRAQKAEAERARKRAYLAREKEREGQRQAQRVEAEAAFRDFVTRVNAGIDAAAKRRANAAEKHK